MASITTKFSYQRLKQDHTHEDYEETEREVIVRSKSRIKWRRVRVRRRYKLKLPNLRRLLRIRKARRLWIDARALWAKILRRLKDGQAHFGDLFAGNYLFMQVNPTSFKCSDKSYRFNNCTLPRIA